MTTLKQFKVRGTGQFPLDMLRYDCCWPATQVDTSAMARQCDPDWCATYSVTLSTNNRNAPTIGRWESFGWQVYP